MSPEDKDKLNALFGHAVEQQEMAKTAISEMAKERAQLNKTIEALQNTAGGLQKAAGDAAGSAVRATLGQAPKDAQTAINAATTALEIAAGKVTAAGAWLTWQFGLVFILTGAAAVLTNYAIGYFTQSQIADLRVEKAKLLLDKAELEANIAELHKRGGKIKFARCGGRPCIEASTNQGTDAAGNPYPMGSWLTTDDRKVPLVIPRGY
jgi:predicted  nucleic acid-binding Zn-ribbon protein